MDILTANTYKRLIGWQPKLGDRVLIITYPYENREGLLVGVYNYREAHMYGDLCVSLIGDQPKFPLSMSLEDVILICMNTEPTTQAQ